MKKKLKPETKIRIDLIKRGMNQAHLHYHITPSRIYKMPSKTIGEGEAVGKMQSKYWNPVYFYPKGVKLLPNEIGHDRVLRYTLKPKLKN